MDSRVRFNRRLFARALACAVLAVLSAPNVEAQQPAVLRGSIAAVIGGENENRDAYLFDDIRGLAFDSRGRIVVADARHDNVRVFSIAGDLLFSFGRPGSGPGDLKQPCCIAIDKKGRLWIQEPGNRRYSIFELGTGAARFLWTVRMPTQSSGLLDRIAWGEGGLLLDVATLYSAPTRRFRLVRSKVDSLGVARVIDTLPDPPDDSLARTTLTRTLPGGAVGSTEIAQPFGPHPLRAFGPDGEFATAISSQYAVSWYDQHGKRLRLLVRRIEAPALSRRETLRAEETLDAMARRNGIRRGALPFGVPSRKAPLQNIAFDLRGRLWVEHSVSAGADGIADVYSRSGSHVGVFSWPTHVRMHLAAVNDSLGLGIGVDSLGAQSVVILRFAAPRDRRSSAAPTARADLPSATAASRHSRLHD